MKNLILCFLVFASVIMTGCKACNGPAGNPGNGNGDTTSVGDSTSHDSIPDSTKVVK